MDIRRLVLFSALALVGYSLMTAWQTEHPRTNPVLLTQHDTALPTPSTDIVSPVGVNEQSQNTHPESFENSPTIQVKTDVFLLQIDLKEGSITEANLLKYPQSAEDKTASFVLLNQNQSSRYVANSNLYTLDNNAVKSVDSHFVSAHESYEMKPNQSTLTVTLTGHNEQGLQINKIFTFNQGSYLIDVQYSLENTGETPWTGYLNTQILRTSPSEDKSSPFHIGSYIGASYSSPGVHRYQKVTFKEMEKENLDKTAEGGWVAMQQRYFLTAWIPYPDSKNRFYTRTTNGNYTIGSVGQSIKLTPTEKQTVRTRLYLGPEVADTLKSIAPGLDLTIDYGWLWFISSLIFSLMKMIYQFIGNWGWSIVIVTALIKLAFYRLSATSYRSMAAMRKLQPKMQALRERYGDDKAKMSQATMELYRQEKVNPLAGCLPLIVQIPVMIALYWVLAESVQLRLAPFVFWITDLASPDPWHVLPVLMGITMLIQQKLNPAPPDPMQAKVMMFLPILFTGLFWNFPSGLVLYWTVNNTLTILQQWYITRKYNDEKPKKTWAQA
jgi:YidC/Oxa1 family membrane protein insertase